MPRRPLLGNHQRCWIWGRNLLRETLRAGRWRPYALHLAGDAEHAELRELAASRDVPVTEESASRLAQRCGSHDHQGAIAKMPPFPYASAEEVLEAHSSCLVVTDHLQDPYNFGAILRAADCFSASGILIPTDRQVGITSQVARSSAGAVNHLAIARSGDLPRDLGVLKSQGRRIIAASEHASDPLPQADLTGPLVLVIGNEGAGISRTIREICDLAVSIPITSDVGSLNAAVAAGIVLYEITRQAT